MPNTRRLILLTGAADCPLIARQAAAIAGSWITTTGSTEDLLSEIREDPECFVVVDHPNCSVDSLDLLHAIQAENRHVPVIFGIRSHETRLSLRLIRSGAYFCYHERMEPEELAEILIAADEELNTRRENHTANARPWNEWIVGESPAVNDLGQIVELVSRRRCTVLITGETGTGKEVVARAIHRTGDRARFPMVAVNCSAIPETLFEAELFGHARGAFTGAVTPRAGRFEEARNGTLFLDEIGDLPFDMQAKLLRVLQERVVQRLGSTETIPVDVRVIAATNVDLEERVRQGKFREDLYYRLNVVPIPIPTLRDRLSDIPLLARHFVARICRQEGIAQKYLCREALDKLMRYHWPGNVRQLENIVEKAVVLSDDRAELRPSDFPLPSSGQLPVNVTPDLTRFPVPDHGMDFARTMTMLERTILDQALVKTRGNKTMAAELLGMKRTTLMSKLRVLEAVPA